MVERLTLLWALRGVTREHVRDTFEWLLYTGLGSLVPVWVGILLFLMFYRPIPWMDFLGHGEFALYSAALIAPSLYLVVTDREEAPFPRRGLFVLGAGVVLLFSVTLFAGITVLIRADLIQRIDDTVVAWLSLLLFFVSISIAFLVTLLDNSRRFPAVRKIAEQTREELENRFDRLP